MAAAPAMSRCTVRHCKLSGCVPLPTTGPRILEPGLLASYLERLGLTKPAAPSLPALEELLCAHVDRVAYENLDVQLARTRPALDPIRSAERIALQKRGGYCFLLVDAFSSLLSSLGFVVSLHTAVCAGVPEPEVMWGEHVVLIVHLEEGDFIADVGLGEGSRSPVRLEDAAWTEDGFEFSLQARSGGEWRFENPINATGCLPGFAFDMSTSAPNFDEFDAFHEFYWSHPDSNYVTSPVFFHRKTKGQGILSMHACTLRRTHPELPGGKEVLTIASSKEEWFRIVNDVFFIPLDDLDEHEKQKVWELVSTQHRAHA
ncbi:nhoA, partial [Symbiodinium sp. KB8]